MTVYEVNSHNQPALLVVAAMHRDKSTSTSTVPPWLPLIAPCRKHLGGIVQFLQLHAEQPGLTVIVTQAEIEEALTPRRQDLPAAAAAAKAAAEAAAEAMAAMTSDPAVVEAAAAAAAEEVELEWCARGLLKLAAKVALLITMNVLADVLVDDQTLKKQLMNGAGGARRHDLIHSLSYRLCYTPSTPFYVRACLRPCTLK